MSALCHVETDRANLAHGRLPSSGAFRTQPPYGLSCRRVGAVHSINSVGSNQAAASDKRSEVSRIRFVLRGDAFVPKADIGGLRRNVRLVP
jgi:hypothetical protein